MFAAGANGAIVHYDGTTWLHRTITGDPQLEAVDGTSTDNVLAVGAGGTILRFTGIE